MRMSHHWVRARAPICEELTMSNSIAENTAPSTETAKSANQDAADQSLLNDWDREAIPKPCERPLWQGLDGLSVMLFGVVIPLSLIVLSSAVCPKGLTMVLLNHPVETIAEAILLFAIPAINYRVWSSICKDTLRFSSFSRILLTRLGIALGASSIVSAVCVAALIFGCKQPESQDITGFDLGFFLIAIMSLLASFATAHLINKVRLIRDLPRLQFQVVVYALVGAAISLLTFIGAEGRPWLVRLVERKAVAGSPKERSEGLQWLRMLNPEQQLRLECSDARAVGLPGLFIPIKTTKQKQLYFALTGKPFSFRDCTNTDLASLPDDFLGRSVVGERKAGLSLTRSYMTGTVHPEALSSTIDWTLVFKNESATAQEARAEFKVPQGSVVNGLTYWAEGQAQRASFAPTEKPQMPQNMHTDRAGSATVTDLGHDRMLVCCNPVASDDEVKISIRTIVPLTLDGAAAASFVLPRFISTDFDVVGEEHSLRLRSTKQLTASLANFKQGKNLEGDQLLVGTFTERQLEAADLTVTVSNPRPWQTVALVDEIASGHRGKPRFVVQTVMPVVPPIPNHVVVVVDGSSTIEKYAGELQEALAQIPSTIPASIIIASTGDEKPKEPLTLSQGIKALSNMKFVGGQDNLQAVVRAAELAGENRGGAVLWIHGPQSVLSRELYIIPSYVAAPSFYELALDSGDTDTYEFFKNHSEIGPFVQVSRRTSAASDLEHFLSKWKLSSDNYEVTLSEEFSMPGNARIATESESKELVALHAYQECRKFIADKRARAAADKAISYGLVTLASSAYVVCPSRSHDVDLRNTPPVLRGATNGTIGPQIDDATYVTGVTNTGGTVRVNNAANFEALVNCIVNGLGICFVPYGFALLVASVIVKESPGQLPSPQTKLAARKRIIIGLAMVLIGMTLPGIVNWFLASARDANLFS
jgi:hypothetical protein